MKNYGYFKSRLWNLILVAAVLFGYNQMLEKKDLQAALNESGRQLSEMEEILATAEGAGTEGATGEQSYTDGTYEGTGTGFGGEVTVSVTVAEGKITGVEVISAPNEDAAYLETAKEVTDKILEAQSAQVDTISGATFSSTGIIEGTKAALEKAVQ
ncbi:MAG: FMN-binding protein [Lachnospiraceae bacterium]|nr:FMN-binding protein [Lachnospiraceae bacterium]